MIQFVHSKLCIKTITCNFISFLKIVKNKLSGSLNKASSEKAERRDGQKETEF